MLSALTWSGITAAPGSESRGWGSWWNAGLSAALLAPLERCRCWVPVALSTERHRRRTRPEDLVRLAAWRSVDRGRRASFSSNRSAAARKRGSSTSTCVRRKCSRSLAQLARALAWARRSSNAVVVASRSNGDVSGNVSGDVTRRCTSGFGARLRRCRSMMVERR